jgi:nucleotide-binding universal stress UspA family protein
MAKRILIPIDGSEERVVPLVAALARDGGATVRLLRVVPEPEPRVDPYDRMIAYIDQEMARLEAQGKENLAIVKAQLGRISVEAVVRFGDPATETAVEAEVFGADLVVMASPARSLLKRVLTRDLSARTLRRAALPVLVLHESAGVRAPDCGSVLSKTRRFGSLRIGFTFHRRSRAVSERWEERSWNRC